MLYARLGAPVDSYDHGGLTVHVYPNAGLVPGAASGQRFFMSKGGVVVGLRLDDETARRGVVHSVLKPLGVKASTAQGIDVDVVCGLPNQPDLGLLLVWAPNGLLAESAISPWKGWTLTPNPCAPP